MTEAQALEGMLDQLHQCILAADFVKLPKILAETERLTDALSPLCDKAVAESIRHKAHRNGLCLQAAARGLRAAQRRVGEVSTATTQLSTYTNVGKRSEVNIGPGTMAKRL